MNAFVPSGIADWGQHDSAFGTLCAQNGIVATSRAGRTAKRRAVVRLLDGRRLRTRAGFQSRRHQTMLAGRRSQPHSRGALFETLPGERRAVAACGLVRQPLRRRAGQRGERCDGVWCGVGVADVAG